MTGGDQWLTSWRAGNGNIDAVHRLIDRGAGLDVQAAITAEFIAQGCNLVCVPAPYPHSIDRTHQAQRLQLQTCLLTGADQGHTATVIA
ncbi:hypothetical protein D3C80_2041470 [compost metagenome]